MKLKTVLILLTRKPIAELWQTRVIVTLVVATTAIVLIFSALIFAAPPTVSLEIAPAAMKIPPQGEVQALVVARNPTTDTLRSVRLSWFTDAGVTVNVDAPATDVLGPYGTLAWTLRLAQTPGQPAAGTLHLQLDYAWQEKDEAEVIHRIALGAIEIEAREPDKIAPVAELKMEATSGAVMERRPGTIYLLLTNTTDQPIQVTGIDAQAPFFVTLTPLVPPDGVSVQPRETRSFPFQIEAQKQVQSGKHLLAFEVGVAWIKDGQPQTQTLAATREVEVGVLGESEILTLLGVPTLLFLPGFLMVVTLGVLWQWVWPKEQFVLQAKTPEFWLFAITLSLLTMILVPWITGRDYLGAYGLSDLVWLWMASISAAAGAYLLVSSGYRLWERTEARSYESPVTVLRKLDSRQLGLCPRRVKIKIGAKQYEVFLLEHLTRGKKTVWVAPFILFDPGNQLDSALYQEIYGQMAESGDPGKLAELFERGERTGQLDVRWETNEDMSRPYKAQVADIEPQQVSQEIIVKPA